MGRSCGVITLVLKYLYFKKASKANFSGIIKILTMVIKTSFKDSKKDSLYIYVLLDTKIIVDFP